jgi:hypothetical protein
MYAIAGIIFCVLFMYVLLGGPVKGYLRKGQWRKDKKN